MFDGCVHRSDYYGTSVDAPTIIELAKTDLFLVAVSNGLTITFVSTFDRSDSILIMFSSVSYLPLGN